MQRIRVKVRERVRVKKPRVKHEMENKDEQAFLFILFWLTVLIECVGLLKRGYTFYAYSRPFVVSILLVRVFRSVEFKKIDIYIYLCLLFSFLADIFTIFGSYSIGYIGLSLYTVSYISLGCYFQQVNENHNNSHVVFIVSFVILGAICCLWLYSPELRGNFFYIPIAFHCAVLTYLIYETFKKYKKIEAQVVSIFVFAVTILVITNILYGFDVLYFQRKYAIVDALVGLGNAMYLFLITRGALKYKERG